MLGLDSAGFRILLRTVGGFVVAWRQFQAVPRLVCSFLLLHCMSSNMQGKSYDSGYGSGRNGSSYGGGSYGGSSYGSSYGGGGGWGQAGDIVPWRMGDANPAPGEYVAVRRLRFIPTYQPEAMDFVSFFFKNPISRCSRVLVGGDAFKPRESS